MRTAVQNSDLGLPFTGLVNVTVEIGRRCIYWRGDDSVDNLGGSGLGTLSEPI
jgi:hypothetical protein